VQHEQVEDVPEVIEDGMERHRLVVEACTPSRMHLVYSLGMKPAVEGV
jgi:hypothetical protein